MIDLDNDKDKIICRGEDLEREIKDVQKKFDISYNRLNYPRRELCFFKESKRFLNESRKRLRKFIRPFNEYDSYVSQYLNEIATARNIIVKGKNSPLTPEARQKSHIFSEQVIMQSKRLHNSLKFFQESIINFEKELTNTKLLYATYILLAVGIIQIIPFILRLIDILSKIIFNFKIPI